MKEKVEFRKVRDFEALISGTLLFIKQNFKPLLKSFYAFCGVFVLGGLIPAVFMQMQMADVRANIQAGNYDGMSAWDSLIGWRYLLVIVFAVLNYTAAYTSVISFVAVYIAKGNVAPTIEEVWNYFKYYFFRVMWSGVLLYIIWIVCAVLCIVPGIYVTPAFSIFFAIMILENQDFGTSFSRAFALVKDNWWITFATIIVIGIVTFIFMLIVQAPTYIIMMIGAISGTDLEVLRIYQILTVLFQYLSQVFMIIPLVCTVMIYSSLVERKESQGLLDRMEEFGKPATPIEHPDEDY